jgi:predicted MFS family arabinose efflux permease
MRSSLRLSYNKAGLLGTANAGGYLVGAICVPRMNRWITERNLFRVGVIGTAIGLASTAATNNYAIIATSRAVTGLLSAASFLLGSSFAARLATAYPPAVAVFNAGVGVGIMFDALTIPLLLRDSSYAWRSAWLALAVAASIAAVFTLSARVPDASSAIEDKQASKGRSFWGLSVAYGCFGSGYIVYITYIVTTVRTSQQSTQVIALAFGSLGLLCVLSPLLWRRTITKSKHLGRAMGKCLAMQTTAALIVLVTHQDYAVIASTTLFGSAFMIAPALTTSVIRNSRAPSEWAKTISSVTIPFATAQTLAPWIIGTLIDRLGPNVAPLWAATFLLTGTAVAIHTDWTTKTTQQTSPDYTSTPS